MSLSENEANAVNASARRICDAVIREISVLKESLPDVPLEFPAGAVMLSVGSTVAALGGLMQAEFGRRVPDVLLDIRSCHDQASAVYTGILPPTRAYEIEEVVAAVVKVLSVEPRWVPGPSVVSSEDSTEEGAIA